MPSQSPTALGAFRWWRCDQNLSLDGSNLVQSWTDAINGSILSQGTAANRPGITSARFNNTAVNFTARGQRLVSEDPASTYKFLVDGSACHVLIVIKVTDTGANLNTLLSVAAGGFVSSPYWAAGWDNRTASLLVKRYAAFLTNNAGTVVLNIPQSTADNTFPNNTDVLYEYAYSETGGGGADGYGWINYSQVFSRDRGATSLATNDPSSTLVLGGSNDPGTTTYGLQGYVQDVIIFKRILSSSDQNDLHDYIRELRGVTTALFSETGSLSNNYETTASANINFLLDGSSLPFSFAADGTLNENFNITNDTTFSFDTDGAVRGEFTISGDVPFSLDVYGTAGTLQPMDGSTTFSFDTSGDLAGAPLLSGDLPFSFNTDGILSKGIDLDSSNITFGFDLAATLESGIDLSENLPFSTTTNADLGYIFKALAGDTGFQFNTAGAVLGPELEGHTNFSFSTNAEAALNFEFSGFDNFQFNTTGNAITYPTVDVQISGSTAFGFNTNGYVGILFPSGGSDTFNFQTNGLLILDTSEEIHYMPSSSSTDGTLGTISFTPEAAKSPTFIFTVRPVGSDSLILVFTDPVDDSALNPLSYYLAFVTPAALPPISKIEFADSNRTKVFIQFSYSFSYGKQYQISAPDVYSYYGDKYITPVQFSALVPDPPKAINAVICGNGYVDVVFDRPVGPHTSAAAGFITSKLSSTTPSGTHQSLLSMIAWTDSIPDNHVRFSISTDFTVYGSIQITFTNVEDESGNSGNGSINLVIPNEPSFPYLLSSITDARLIHASVDSVQNFGALTDNTVRINVFFNRLMYGPDVIDTSNWSVSQQGVHPITDSTDNIATSPFPLLANLLAFCNQAYIKFNAHFMNTLYHKVTPSIDESSVISLTRELITNYNSHIPSTNYHAVADTTNSVSSPLPNTLDECIVVLNTLKTKFNIHRTAASVHAINDTDFAVSSTAVDINTAAILADELKSKIMNHMVGSYHTVPDANNIPIQRYTYPTIIPPALSSLADALRFIEEAQSKYFYHAMDDKLHLYADKTHVDGISLNYYTNLADVQTAAFALRSEFNGHLLSTFPVTILSVKDFASSSSSFSPVNNSTYFAQLEVKNPYDNVYFTIGSQVQSEDLGSTTSFGDTVIANSFNSQPVCISPQSNTESMEFVFDKGVNMPDFTTMTLTSQSGIRSVIKDVKLTATHKSLYLITVDLMNSYRWHNYPAISGGAEHRILDSVNYILDGEFPTIELSSIISSLNRLKDVFNQHVVYSIVHAYPDLNTVNLPYATDHDSAVELARALAKSIQNHNRSLSHHYSSGYFYGCHELMDTMTIMTDGFKDGDEYQFTCDITKSSEYSQSSPSTPYKFSQTVIGKAIPPVLASVSITGGVRSTPSGRFFSSDRLTWEFTKPMSSRTLSDSSINIDPPIPGSKSNQTWEGSRTLSVPIYQFSGIHEASVINAIDLFGNEMNPLVSRGVNLLYVYETIPGLSDISRTFNDNFSIHYNSSRPTAYVTFKAYENHVVDFKSIPSMGLNTEVYMYDSKLNLIASSASSALLNRVLFNCVAGESYIYEITVTNPMTTGSFQSSLASRFEPDSDIAIEATWETVIGLGETSVQNPEWYGVSAQFVATAVLTYIHVQSSDWVSVKIYHNSLSGAIVAGGSGSGTFVFPVTTSISGTYVMEVSQVGSSPQVVYIKPSNSP